METKNSYKQVVKSFSLFGGVQVFEVIIGLVRSKVLAELLGTVGVGLNNLIQQPLNLIGTATGLGISFTGVRDIAAANEENNVEKISKTMVTVKRWAWLTGIIGMLIVIFFSPWLYKLTFSEDNAGLDYSGDYKDFIFLSVILLLMAISGSQTAILKGIRKLKDTAKTGLFGSFFGLILTIPLYYFYGINGIVPALIAAAVINLFFSWYYSRKVKVASVNISYKQSFADGMDMAKLGFLLSLTNLIGMLVTYSISLFLNYYADKSEVGLYTTGATMTYRYVGLVFTAISVDYFPRLVGLQSKKEKMAEAVNQQSEIAILIVAPLMILYTAFLPVIVKILNTSEFLPIIDFVRWFILGMLFRTVSWALGFIVLAKGDKGLFFFSETASILLSLVLNVGGYILFGLEGMGIAFVTLYLVYFTMMVIIAWKKYGFVFSKEFSKLFLVQFLICIACFLLVYLKGYPFAYTGGTVLFAVSMIYSVRKLNERINLKEIIRTKVLKKK
ncbi:O-antigen translocase [Bacteroidia bacterium]|nr:O-antigen translocase [Bacteroidia bacterium]